MRTSSAAMNKGGAAFRTGAATVLLLRLCALDASADAFQTVSRFDSSLAPSTTGGGGSSAAITTPDGRYIAFASAAKNLALSSNHTAFAAAFVPSYNVYWRDRTNGTTTLVSVNVSGTGGANADSIPTGISSNGQFVLFESFAGNLVTNTTTGAGDVYLRDMVNGLTFLVSISTTGAVGNQVSRDSAMTPDGRYVAFASLANNLVPNDTNGIFDIFVRDMIGGTTQLASVSTSGSPASGAGAESRVPSMTPDGRYVLFYSTASNLVTGVPPPGNLLGNLYLRDMLSNTTTWVSAGAQGMFLPANSNSISFNGVISDDGSHVAYEACSAAYPSPVYGSILRYNVQSGLTDIVDTNALVQPFVIGENTANLDMTPDGRFIAFVGNAGALGSAQGFSFTNAVFLWDSQSGSNTLVSANLTNGVSPGAESDLPAISTNGQFVTFVSSDTNLTTNLLNGTYHLYRRDMLAGVTQLIDVDANGAGAGVTSDTAPVISSDASLVVYPSISGNITGNDRNRDFDIFVRNTAAQITELVSVRDATLPSSTPDGSSGLTVYSVSTNGRFVAFASEADDVTTGATTGVWNIFERDLLNATSTLVSIGTNGLPANGPSFEPAVSGDGRYIAFTSYATNLAPGDTNASRDVFLRDTLTGITTLVSVGQDGVSFGSSNSWQPSISADGRYVLFHSLAQNLSSGTIGIRTEDIYLRDTQSNTTYALATVSSTPGLSTAAMTPDGRYVAFVGRPSNSNATYYLSVWSTQMGSMIYSNPIGSNFSVSVSADGQKVAWWNSTPTTSTMSVADVASGATNAVAAGNFGQNGGMQFSADGNLLAYAVGPALGAGYSPYAYKTYLFNFQTGSNTLISHTYSNPATAASGSSDSPAISADGRFIVYRSSAVNLVAGVTNGIPNLFVYDNLTGVNSLLTLNSRRTGPADSFSRAPVFSSDGRTVAFQSWSSDLTSSGDFNDNADLFEYAFPYLQIAPPASALEGPILSWLAAPGQKYSIQYSDSLAGGSWQTLTAELVITGNQAVLSNMPPVSGQRFYRLVIH